MFGQRLDVGRGAEAEKEGDLLEHHADRQHDHGRGHADQHLAAADADDAQPLHGLGERTAAEPADADHGQQRHQHLLRPEHGHRDAAAQVVLLGQRLGQRVQTDGQRDQHVDHDQHGEREGHGMDRAVRIDGQDAGAETTHRRRQEQNAQEGGPQMPTPMTEVDERRSNMAGSTRPLPKVSSSSGWRETTRLNACTSSPTDIRVK